MILTVTLNPSVDKTYILRSFSPRNVNRAERVMYHAGSKGINVSRVAQLLGEQTCALGFVGGSTGDTLITKLNEEGITHDFVRAENFQTRLNVKIMELDARAVTDINESGDPISEWEWDSFLERYKGYVPGSDIVVVSGSLLPEMPARVYVDLIKVAGAAQKPVFLDCGGDVLKESVKASPYLIKPNRLEFEQMLRKSLSSDGELVTEAREIISRWGVEYVVVTLGRDGAIGVSRDGAYRVLPPNVIVSSTVGAGDAFLAGMCHAHMLGLSFPRQLVLGSSCANAKITKEGNDIPSLIELLGYADGCQIIPI